MDITRKQKWPQTQYCTIYHIHHIHISFYIPQTSMNYSVHMCLPSIFLSVTRPASIEVYIITNTDRQSTLLVVVDWYSMRICLFESLLFQTRMELCVCWWWVWNSFGLTFVQICWNLLHLLWHSINDYP